MDSIESKPVGQHSDEAQGREVIPRKLIVSGGNATPILETTEAALDDVATLVGFFVVSNALLSVGFARNDGLDPMAFEPSAKRIGVVAFVSQ